MVDEINSAKYAAKRKAEGKNLFARIALILFYILFCAVYICVLASIRFVQPIAVLPVFLWMLVHYTWGYVSYDYEYCVGGGRLSVVCVSGKRRTELFSCRVSEALEIAPLTQKSAQRHREHAVLDLRSKKDSPQSYYVATREGGDLIFVYFEVTEAMVRILARLNENTKQSKELQF